MIDLYHQPRARGARKSYTTGLWHLVDEDGNTVDIVTPVELAVIIAAEDAEDARA